MLDLQLGVIEHMGLALSSLDTWCDELEKEGEEIERDKRSENT